MSIPEIGPTDKACEIVSDAVLREALRVTSEALSDTMADRLRNAALRRVEHYMGRLYGQRTYLQRWTVLSTLQVRPGDPWQPTAKVTDWAKWTPVGGWAAADAPPSATPELVELGPGEWRAAGTIGADEAPADVIEAMLRVAGYLFEVDPGGQSMGSVMHRSGAAALLGPYVERVAAVADPDDWSL